MKIIQNMPLWYPSGISDPKNIQQVQKAVG